MSPDILPDILMVLAVVLPLVGAGLVTLVGERSPNLREGVSLATAVALFAVVAALYPMVTGGGRPEVVLVAMLPGLSLALRLEPLGMLFAGLASFLWIVTTIYAIGYMREHHEKNQTRFYAFFAIAIAAAMGVAMAANMATLFLFYEVLTLGTFPLVTHHGTDAARRGGRVYLAVLLGTSIGFQLLAIVWTWSVAGTLDFTDGGILEGKVSHGVAAALFMLYMFGIGKAALMPFHRWLPAAMVAPAPVSALLHAVAVVKAGVFTVLKVVVYLFGIDVLTRMDVAGIVPFVAAFTLIAASVIALRQDNLKARLAYSTISQLAYIVLGASLATPAAVLGGALHIAMHAFGKITLFFCAGAILIASHKTEVSQLDGIGRRMPWTLGAFAVASLSMIGLPPTAGFVSKWLLVEGAWTAGHGVALAALAASTLLNAAYFLPIVYAAFFKPERQPPRREHGEAALPMVAALVLTAAGTVWLFFDHGFLLRLLGPLTGGEG